MIVSISEVKHDPVSFVIKASAEDKKPWKVTGVPGSKPKPISQVGFLDASGMIDFDQACKDADGPSRIVVRDDSQQIAYIYDASPQNKK